LGSKLNAAKRAILLSQRVKGLCGKPALWALLVGRDSDIDFSLAGVLKAAESGVKGCQIWQLFHPDYYYV
jgi:hypothetical protein